MMWREWVGLVLDAGAVLGWLQVGCSVLIGRLDLFGLRQVWFADPNFFASPSLLGPVRHPLHAGLLLAVWSTSSMTGGRVLVAAAVTGCAALQIALQERNWSRNYGDMFRAYRSRVPMLIPTWLPRDSKTSALPSAPVHCNTDFPQRT